MNEKEKRLSKRKVIKSVTIFCIYLVVLYFLIRYVVRNTDMLERIADAPASLVALGVITTVLGIVLSGFLDITCAKVYGIKLPSIDVVVFTFVASAMNLVLPLQIGSMVKAIHYKKKMRLTYSRYLSVISGTIIINLMVTFIVLIMSLFVTMIKWNTDKKYIVIVSLVFIIGVAIVIVVLLFQERILKILPFKTYTLPVMTGFFEIFNNKRAMVVCSLNHLFMIILGGIRFATIFRCLDVSTGFVNGMLYYGLYCTSTIVPILPGNVGISEAIVGVMNLIIGSDFDVGVAIVLINRIYYYVIALLGALLSAIPALILYRKGFEKKNER